MIRIFLAMLLIGWGSATFATGFISFQSPSGNIHCMFEDDGDVDVRCDRINFQNAPPAPADCDLDWGHAYAVGTTGHGFGVCAGDTVATGNSFVLEYGKSISVSNIFCHSVATGITCQNQSGGGFSISKTKHETY